MMVKKIISGGQTGADQAALDVAINLRIPHGGWIPKGRKTENGVLPDKYQLKEIPSSSYQKRTEKNVLDSDDTLIIFRGKLTGGSSLTKKLATKHGRACLYIDLDTINGETENIIKQWIVVNQIKVLNVAGPRASKLPQIYEDTVNILESLLT